MEVFVCFLLHLCFSNFTFCKFFKDYPEKLNTDWLRNNNLTLHTEDPDALRAFCISIMFNSTFRIRLIFSKKRTKIHSTRLLFDIKLQVQGGLGYLSSRCLQRPGSPSEPSLSLRLENRSRERYGENQINFASCPPQSTDCRTEKTLTHNIISFRFTGSNP